MINQMSDTTERENSDDQIDSARNQELDIEIMDRSVEILTAYLSNPSTHTNIEGIPDMYRKIREALKEDFTRASSAGGLPAEPEQTPAVPISKSVTDEYIICLECGGKHKAMKRHLSAQHNLTPAQYKQKWNLPDDYPLVAKSYSEQRSQLALKNNLGEMSKRRHRKNKSAE